MPLPAALYKEGNRGPDRKQLAQSQWVMEQGFKPKQEDSRTFRDESSRPLPPPHLDMWTLLVFILQKREGLWLSQAPIPTF